MTQAQAPISDYALIGNGQTAALVSRSGSIDWCCWPRFDSPAVFCRLLDEGRGGCFQVAPADSYRVSRAYLGPTNVLQTSFTTESGVLQLTDLMPAPSEHRGESVFPHRILRRVECVKGRVDVHVAFRPTFDYARTPARFELRPQGAIAFGQDEALGLVCSVPLRFHHESIAVDRALSEGEHFWMILTHGPSSESEQLLQFDANDAVTEYKRTIAYWERWSGECRYDGPYRDLVLRSALVLKLLVFQPSGGLIAAPTTSLPAEIGGERNWDYRFTWLRDAGLLLDALQQLGYHDESMQFIDWLEKLCECGEGDLRSVYTVDAEPAPTEQTLGHLAGYRDSKPVRIGNAAVEQTQIDNYGHILDAVVLCYERMPREVRPELWEFLRKIVNRAAAHWERRDQGPWEIRGPARHYLYSKLYCWVGFDRAIRFAEKHQLPGEIDYWKEQRNAVREAILSRGFHKGVRAFTQAFDNEELDASVLTIPLVGFLPASDARVRSTIEHIQERLCSNGLLYRYQMYDGLPGSDATFTLCSFWLVMNLALAGEKDRAAELFERICGYANDVGLLSEQIDPTSGELLGNFPQGFTHLGLIRAALYLNDSAIKLDRR